MTAPVINLRRHRIRKARHRVQRERLFRLQGEYLLCRVAQACRDLQADLDAAVAVLQRARKQPKRKSA
jgi:hypothetical protein